MKNSIFAVNIKNFAETFKEGLRLIVPAAQQDVMRFKFEKDRHRKLVSALLLRLFVKNFLNLSEYSVSKNKYGKPYLNDYPNFHFNLSHSGNWVVGAVSDKPLGIDIEQIHQINDFMDIAKRFFSEKEYTFLVECEEKSKIALFYDIWTKKESLIKAVGKGLSIPLRSFTVPFNTTGIVDYNGAEWNVISPVFNDESYKISLCFSPIKQAYAEVKNIVQNELVKKY